MEVMLREEIKNLGKAGDIVKVADGYARNYLLPKKFASLVTPAVLKQAEKIREKRLQQEHLELQRLQALGERLSGFLCTVEVRANEEGQLFGAVHERDIVDALLASGFEELRLSNIVLESPVRDLGDHEVEIRLHPEVRVHVTLRVTAMAGEAATENADEASE